MTTFSCAETCGQCELGCAKRETQSTTEERTHLSLGTVDSRRGVVRRAILGVAGLGLAGIAVGCNSGMRDDKPDVSEVTVARADVPPVGGAPYRSNAGHFYLVQNADGILALSWTCTHQGCEVPWKDNEQRFHCPCHGSIYDRNGVRTDGPAPRSLDLVKVDVLANGDVAVKTGEKTKRSDYDSDQAVPYPA